ncbi:2-keto-4-pentenoate hydratase/2-oxohepta-3-ene-1,7-dioic acid hydratase (catechol pathway) [Gracilibacillus orientalis]|uniref:2-keto-4-pentenoate hydratase/2-oxohepta-3-ene-1,7-dioic acid hydratase (Catechol pathway) n=1 Tax=Gracilibacillus orientalis TaxID=334253 RepID=A0A1I4JNK0_9BACI|nr:fumarylacetoacetate hydrolase family protein [Gracilibacillus orientalis]SFL68175.1 2-keto-4-pentenoate hydratase/2-oxohepta-3-ene-1,7-dioic acid hydratase (catechol pathway) [Gracilibacillus orientalis]
MKLVNYQLKHPYAQNRIGVIEENKIIDLHAAQQELLEQNKIAADSHIIPADPHTFYEQANVHIKHAEALLEQITNHSTVHVFDRDEVVLKTPSPTPSKIICIGTNYADHVKEMGSELPEYPVLFSKFNNALIGPEADIHKSEATDKLDYEVELTVVIGEKASKVAREEALEYVAGYTIGNDISARDLQKRTPQWLQGKSLDHTTPIGPWLVTPSELADPSNLAVKSYVNGELRQSSNTEHLIFDISDLISFISNLITLDPGDIILTGTPDGVGFAMNPPKLLQSGDIVTLEIDKIGTLENKVIAK